MLDIKKLFWFTRENRRATIKAQREKNFPQQYKTSYDNGNLIITRLSDGATHKIEQDKYSVYDAVFWYGDLGQWSAVMSDSTAGGGYENWNLMYSIFFDEPMVVKEVA